MTPTQEYIQKAIKEFNDKWTIDPSFRESRSKIKFFLEQKLREIVKVTELAIRDEAESLEQLKPVIKYHNKLSYQEGKGKE